MFSSSTTTTKTVLVVGATGATGKHVVAQLLKQPDHTRVKVLVRSAARMQQLLQGELKVQYDAERLEIVETPDLLAANVLEAAVTDQVDVVVSCLGHNLTFSGIWGHPRTLVTDVVTRLYQALAQQQQQQNNNTPSNTKKFILMGSDGVSWAGHDDPRTFLERSVLFLLRYLIPPHADNESAAAYLLTQQSVEWVIVRPTDLVDETSTASYQLFGKPQGSLFGSGTATRSHVADAMVTLMENETLWQQWKYQMPVLMDDDDKAETKKTK